MRYADGPTTHSSVVIEAPLFEWAVGDPSHPSATWRFDLERVVARRLEEHRANMQATVDGVKALAEGSR